MIEEVKEFIENPFIKKANSEEFTTRFKPKKVRWSTLY